MTPRRESSGPPQLMPMFCTVAPNRATFCGIIPAGEPELVVLVTLDFEARTRYHQGGNSAGPVFKRLTTAALRYLMIPPDRPEELEEADDEDPLADLMEERGRRQGDLLQQESPPPR